MFKTITRTFLLFILFSTGCGIIQKRAQPLELPGINTEALTPEQAEAQAGEMIGDWAYGEGLGTTMVQIGAVIAFPPFAIALIGNAGLSLSGYEPVTVAKILPEPVGNAWKEGFSTVVSAPGKVSAAVAGEEFRSDDLLDARKNNSVVILESARAQQRLASQAVNGVAHDK